MPTEIIIKKMMEQLTAALQQSEHKDTVKKHIEHVQLLCELIIEESEGDDRKSAISVQDLEKSRPTHSTSVKDEDKDDGTSIFDF